MIREKGTDHPPPPSSPAFLSTRGTEKSLTVILSVTLSETAGLLYITKGTSPLTSTHLAFSEGSQDGVLKKIVPAMLLCW